MQTDELILLIESVSKSGVLQFIYKTENESLSILKTGAVGQNEKPAIEANAPFSEAPTRSAVHKEHTTPIEPMQPIKVNEAEPPTLAGQNSNLVDVPAPFVGSVVLNDSKTGNRFVELGDKVLKGQLLFVMESMKLFTDVMAPASGKIAQICVDNNQIVEFGTVILKIEEE